MLIYWLSLGPDEDVVLGLFHMKPVSDNLRSRSKYCTLGNRE